MAATDDQFPQDATGRPEARAAEAIVLGHGDRFDLRIALAAKRFGEGTMRMLACNGSIARPIVWVREAPKSSSTSRTMATWRRQSIGIGYASSIAPTAPTRPSGRWHDERPTPRTSRSPNPGIDWYHLHIGKDSRKGRCARATS